MILVQTVATHIITGFLGAGKTTLLKKLLAQKPEKEIWAVLMNEFGEIGLDQSWVAEQQGIAVKEVLGGCLCCTSQLPMQITLARLLTEYKPHRLFIEPTGLGHPKMLIEQLSEPHWRASLQLKQVITLLDGHRLHEQLWKQYDIILQQLDVADVIVVSHHQQMQAEDHQQLQQLQHAYAYSGKHWQFSDFGKINLKEIDVDRENITVKKQPLLSLARSNVSQISENHGPKTLPYYYQTQRQGYYVAGWHLPKNWQFETDTLLHALQQLEQPERIKAKLNTEQGWIDINAIPSNFAIDVSAQAGLDNRLEIISRQAQDWREIETILLNSQMKVDLDQA
ncbi:GTP-binding protein [Acinetobacter qingfengensis]|uniref:CobW/HypB/UreG nucleotide-binding domain-containing protein n=1 Tax=Acinetobacter qingfengensis TaxID=1262585 RepID=A0A1E7RC83_9GAMM|nr:GTP-binding protein [Acinetobacter qingfengensis]KAA8735268.1 GTP-binding protein [Acinetobacter qingfengensis]OEY96958.1 hypothetical protein BJI46_11345 [Acinetobacter qingfengensis]